MSGRSRSSDLRPVTRLYSIRALSCALLTLLPAAAQANVYETFGASARAMGLAGSGVATVSDPSAVWYNPAGLDRSGDAFTFGILAGFNRGSVLLADRPSGYDPPGYADRINPRVDQTDPATYAGLRLGLSMRLLSEKLTLGLNLYVPFSGFGHLDTHYADERAQNFSNSLSWSLVGERLKSEVIAGAVSYRMSPWFTFGAGVNVQPRSNLITHVYTRNAVDPSDVDLNLSVEQSATYGLLAGIMLEPRPWLDVGLTFHDEVYFSLSGYNEVELPETGEVVRQPLDMRVHSAPPRGMIAVGVTLDALTISVEGVYNGWSRFRDTQGEDAGFEDTLDARLGLELLTAEDTRIRGGLGWYSSPVPDQTGRTSYVDNDRLILALGAGREVEVLERTLEIDVGVQIHLLRPRETVKALGDAPDCAPGVRAICDEVPDQDRDTPIRRAAETQGLQTGNPGWPGFSSGGYLVSVGADARWRF